MNLRKLFLTLGLVLSLTACGKVKEEPKVDPEPIPVEVVNYTISWVVGDVTTTTTVEEGVLPVFDGTPTKEATAEFSYTFAGWEPEVVVATADATYTATFTETTNSYTVTFVDEARTVLQTGTYEYGVVPEFTGEVTYKEVAEEDLAEIAFYEFVGWDKDITAVTENVTYTTVYEPVYTYDLAYTYCAAAIDTLFGEGASETFLTDEWETAAMIRFTVNIGSQMTHDAAAAVLGNVLSQALGMNVVSPLAADATTGYYVGIYLSASTGVVAYPLTAMSGENCIIQCQFTHANLLG